VSPLFIRPQNKNGYQNNQREKKGKKISATKSKNKKMTGFSDIFSIHQYGRSKGITFLKM
jgi:hypothetical protein